MKIATVKIASILSVSIASFSFAVRSLATNSEVSSPRCASLFDRTPDFNSSFLETLANPSRESADIAKQLIETNAHILRYAPLGHFPTVTIAPLRLTNRDDVTKIFESSFTARQPTYRLFAQIGFSTVEIPPHVIRLTAEIIATTRRDERPGISEPDAQRWILESLEEAAYAQRPLDTDILIRKLQERHRRGTLPNLTKDEMRELTADLGFKFMTPFYSTDAWLILARAGFTGSKVYDLGGLLAVARAARTGRGAPDLVHAGRVLRDGLLEFGYSESTVPNVLAALQLQQDVARSYFRSRQK